ncbi:hypothetical protein HPP92_010803 [Vanilla planifolia]|uniref:Uncharacterized protein n=1 Tax=Vanilla planifolia TaxID=51239 RepID=A0A835R1N1_VANPL|nr:hypothetical protein HPP92_010803 [Vanilla planifolia]
MPEQDPVINGTISQLQVRRSDQLRPLFHRLLEWSGPVLQSKLKNGTQPRFPLLKLRRWLFQRRDGTKLQHRFPQPVGTDCDKARDLLFG